MPLTTPKSNLSEGDLKWGPGNRRWEVRLLAPGRINKDHSPKPTRRITTKKNANHCSSSKRTARPRIRQQQTLPNNTQMCRRVKSGHVRNGHPTFIVGNPYIPRKQTWVEFPIPKPNRGSKPHRSAEKKMLTPGRAPNEFISEGMSARVGNRPRGVPDKVAELLTDKFVASFSESSAFISFFGNT